MARTYAGFSCLSSLKLLHASYPEMAMYIAVMSRDSVNLNKRGVYMATSTCATYLAAILVELPAVDYVGELIK